MKLFHWIIALLFPPKCILCGKLLGREETDICRSCREETPVYPKGKRKPQFLDSFAAVWYYEEYPRESLLRFKFSGRRNYAPAYGRLLAMKLQEQHPDGFDCLTWVPVSWFRKLTRGYDQVELLAEALAAELGMEPVCTLKKIRHNRRQSSIRGEAQRRANVLGAYRVVIPSEIQGKRVLLLDDILTTGATVEECARMLKSAGAGEVHCAAMAASRK